LYAPWRDAIIVGNLGEIALIDLTIPGHGTIHLQQLVSDVSGQRNDDTGMLRAAVSGITALSHAGLSAGALQNADVLVPDILSALDLLYHPIRLVATLRQ
jgi:hypothetical protein